MDGVEERIKKAGIYGVVAAKHLMPPVCGWCHNPQQRRRRDGVIIGWMYRILRATGAEEDVYICTESCVRNYREHNSNPYRNQGNRVVQMTKLAPFTFKEPVPTAAPARSKKARRGVAGSQDENPFAAMARDLEVTADQPRASRGRGRPRQPAILESFSLRIPLPEQLRGMIVHDSYVRDAIVGIVFPYLDDHGLRRRTEVYQEVLDTVPEVLARVQRQLVISVTGEDNDESLAEQRDQQLRERERLFNRALLQEQHEADQARMFREQEQIREVQRIQLEQQAQQRRDAEAAQRAAHEIRRTGYVNSRNEPINVEFAAFQRPPFEFGAVTEAMSAFGTAADHAAQSVAAAVATVRESSSESEETFANLERLMHSMIDTPVDMGQQQLDLRAYTSPSWAVPEITRLELGGSPARRQEREVERIREADRVRHIEIARQRAMQTRIELPEDEDLSY
jgi:hypothetical protein